MIFVQVKAMAGVNYVRAAAVLAVQYSDPNRCSVLMTGGVLMSCMEPASAVAERLTAALAAADEGAAAKPEAEEKDSSNAHAGG